MAKSTDWIYVTGCDSGFGKALTLMLVEAGYGVFPGIYLEESAAQLHEEAGKKSKYQAARLQPVRLDVTDDDSVANAAKMIGDSLAESGGKLVGLVNNAGILVTPGPVEWTSLDVYKKIYDVNLLGIVRVTTSVMPFLRQSQGRIVNVASIAGVFGLPGQPAYCASKYAVKGFSECLRKDVAQWGVTVHIIEPGIFGQTGLYGTWEKDLTANFERLPDAIKEDYGEEFMIAGRKALNHGLKAGLTYGNNDASVVPKAMLHALTDARPQYCYRVGNDSKYVFPILCRLSEGMQDTLVGFNQAYPKRAASAPKNGAAIARARYASDYTPLFLGASMVVGVVGTCYTIFSKIRSSL